jgi:hypothetical protein
MSDHQKEIIDYLFPNYINRLVERAARHAAEAMREKAAQSVDCGCECRPMVLMDLATSYTASCSSSNICGAIEAAQIRAIPIEGETT